MTKGLVLFFTRGISLRTWAKNGSFTREIALYLRLHNKGVPVTFVTYGDARDLEYEKELGGIKVLCNEWNIPLRLYEWLLPIAFPRYYVKAGVIKTNQTDGAEVALRAARLWNKPLIARCGYMWSEFAKRDGSSDAVYRARQAVERAVFTAARKVVVTTHFMREQIQESYNISARKIIVIPNYVLTDVFYPSGAQTTQSRICFVGRLSAQKNLPALITACRELPLELHLVGEGPLRESLQRFAEINGVNLILHGSLPHHQLPEIIRSSAIFALVSTHEGHPKSLLEAMASGAAVLGADSPGIREQIQHGETGWLVNTDADSIRIGIQRLLSDPALRAQLGRNARRYVLENYSLDNIIEKEYGTLTEVPTKIVKRTIICLAAKRSGTTAIHRMFANHPRVGICHPDQSIKNWEPNFWNYAADALEAASVPAAPEKSEAKSKIEHFRQQVAVMLPQLDTEGALTQAGVFAYWNAIRDAYGPIVFEKSPQYLGSQKGMELLYKYIQFSGDVKVFGLVRDPRDVISSQYEHWKDFFLPGTPEFRDAHWVECYQRFQWFQDLLGKDNCPMIRYEDFSADPAHWGAFIFDYAGLPDAPEAYAHIRPVHVGRYRKTADAQLQRWEFSSKLIELAAHYGYNVTRSSATQRVYRRLSKMIGGILAFFFPGKKEKS